MAQTPVSSAMPLRRPLGLSASKEKSARIRLLQLNFMKRLSAQAGTWCHVQSVPCEASVELCPAAGNDLAAAPNPVDSAHPA
ncbi:unnamed protein product [Lampetra planeri]